MRYNIDIIQENSSVSQSISRIERSNYPFAFIVDMGNKYISQVSIRDLRRLLLSGTDLNSAISQHCYKDKLFLIKENLRDRNSVNSIISDLEKSNIEYCPFLDKNKRITDVFSKQDLIEVISNKSIGNTYQNDSNVHNILVIGGAGYLGSILSRKLLDNGKKVRILDNFLYGKRAIQGLAKNKNIDIVYGDMRNIETVVSSLKDIDAVILLAAIVGDPASKARPTQTIETNLIAAQSLAFACKTQCISRFIYASTCSVYGKSDSILDEKSSLNPVSLYARTKIASEKCIMDMANGNFTPTILRMGTLYGYSPRMRFDLVVNTMTMKAFSEGKIQVFGGNQWRPLLNVSDAADVYINCIDAPLDVIGNQVLNVGSDEQNYQIDQIALKISKTLGNIVIDIEKDTSDARDYRVSFNKVKELLDFCPHSSIETSCEEIFNKLQSGEIANPSAKVYYNHYFDSTEEA